MDDILGYEDDILGAVQRAIVRRAQSRGRMLSPGAARSAAVRAVQSIAPKPPLPLDELAESARLRSFVGIGTASWNGAADTADDTLTIEPQESFRGERLVIDVTAAGGTAAGLVVLRRLEVGTQPQSPSVEQAAPAAMFARDVTYGSLDLQIAHRGTKLSAILGVTAAPGAGVTQTAVVGMFGQWIR